MISLDYKDGRSLHEQIAAQLKELIISGVLTRDEQLPSVRELSVSLTVNPNTVQRAYRELELEGFTYSVKGRGSFVAPVTRAQNGKKTLELYERLTSIIKELMYLGEKKVSIENIVNNIYSEKGD